MYDLDSAGRGLVLENFQGAAGDKSGFARVSVGLRSIPLLTESTILNIYDLEMLCNNSAELWTTVNRHRGDDELLENAGCYPAGQSVESKAWGPRRRWSRRSG